MKKILKMVAASAIVVAAVAAAKPVYAKLKLLIERLKTY